MAAVATRRFHRSIHSHCRLRGPDLSFPLLLFLLFLFFPCPGNLLPYTLLSYLPRSTLHSFPPSFFLTRRPLLLCFGENAFAHFRTVLRLSLIERSSKEETQSGFFIFHFSKTVDLHALRFPSGLAFENALYSRDAIIPRHQSHWIRREKFIRVTYDVRNNDKDMHMRRRGKFQFLYGFEESEENSLKGKPC